jgi:hypothetical protein
LCFFIFLICVISDSYVFCSALKMAFLSAAGAILGAILGAKVIQYGDNALKVWRE